MKMSAVGRIPGLDRFLFDLNGYIIVRNALPSVFVDRLNEGITSQISCSKVVPRDGTALKNSAGVGMFAAEGSRKDLGGVLSWPEPGFRELLAHPKLIPYLTEFLGTGYRLDHQPLVIVQEKESEGFNLHGGPVQSDGRANTELQYSCFNGHIHNTLLAMSVCLVDAGKDDGGFCVVKGSHKASFPTPCAIVDSSNSSQLPEQLAEHVYQPTLKAGDVIFFTEALVHGALPWNSDKQRRIALYRFAPSTSAYGRSYLEQKPFGVDRETLEKKFTPAQRAVLQAPFANRVNREVVTDDGDVKVQRRSEEKMKHDREVFGSDFF